MSAAHTKSCPEWLVMAGANPREKGIHDTRFGHYGVTFATVSLEHEYSHMPETGAKLAAEYANRISALPELLAAAVEALAICRQRGGPQLPRLFDAVAKAREGGVA